MSFAFKAFGLDRGSASCTAAVLLLLANLSFSISVFCYLPFMTTALADYVGLSGADATSLLAIGTFGGNVLALSASLVFRGRWAMPLSIASLTACCVAVLIPIVLRSVGYDKLFYVVLASFTLYRLSIALVFNLTRVLQLEHVSAFSSKIRMLSSTKLFFGAGAALGPLVGYAAFGVSGMLGVAAMATALVVLSATLVVTTGQPEEISAYAMVSTSSSLKQPLLRSKAVVPCVAGFIYVLLESQIYSYITLCLRADGDGYTNKIATLFAVNSIALLITLPLLGPIFRRLQSQKLVLLVSAAASLLSVLLAPDVNSYLDIAIIAVLVTIGEAVVPQILMDRATDLGDKQQNANSVALFNFFASGLGMGIGIWIGSVASSQLSRAESTIVWLGIYSAFAMLVAFGLSRDPKGGFVPA